MKLSEKFQNPSRFGSKVEEWIFWQMEQQGLVVYPPWRDNQGIDAVVMRPNESFAKVQIKSRAGIPEHKVPLGFNNIKCEHQGDYWFIFYFAQLGEKGTLLLMSVDEFMRHAKERQNGWEFRPGGMKNKEIYIKPEYEKYICHDFSFRRLIEVE